MIKPLARVYKASILDHPAWVLLALVALCTWLAGYLPQTRFDASSDSLVLEGDRDLAYSREINERYGAEDFLLVTYRPEGDLFSDAVLARLAALKDELAAVPTVSSVNSILNVPLLYSPPVDIKDISGGLPTLADPGIDRELVRRELAESPIYRDLLSNRDGTVTALQVNLRRDERYFELLEAREALRRLRQEQELSAAQEGELLRADQAFRNYVVEYNARQEQVVAKVRTILDGYRDHAQIFLGGVPMIAVDMIHFVQNDLQVFGVAIVLFIVGLMAAIFRKLRWIVLPLGCCVLTAVAVLGWFAMIDWRLTVISSNFVALLLIINLSIIIHLVVRYRELAEMHPGWTQRELVWDMAESMAKPSLYTSLTTIVAFASFVVSGIRPLIDFGWMMVIGITAALAVSFLLLPCILMLLPREHVAPEGSRLPLSAWFAVLAERHDIAVVVICLALALASVVGISRLQVENRFIDYFSKETEIYRGMETIDRELGGTIPLDVVIDVDPAELEALQREAEAAGGFEDDFGGSLDEATSGDEMFAEETFATEEGFTGNGQAVNVWFTRRGMERVKQVHDYLESLPEVGKVLSLATFYDVVDDLLGGQVDDVQLAIVERNLPASVREVLVDPYYDPSQNQVRLAVRAMETSHTLHRDQLLKDIRAHLVDELGFKPEQVHLSGMLVLYNNMLQSLYRSQILTIGVVFLAILAMFLLLFRSLKQALIALAPNLLAASVVLGGMGLFGIPLDLMTITIAAICVGIGVDDTIHYLHRFGKEFERDRDYVATMHRSHRSIGRAMYYTSIIIIMGFGVLALSNFTPSIYFGLLTGAAMLTALLGALLLLPRLILIFKPFGPPGGEQHSGNGGAVP